MSLPVTEIFISSVKVGAELEDKSSATVETLYKALDVPKALSTAGDLFWGRKIESGDELQAMLGTESSDNSD
jgi:hypothetical protein